MPPRNGQSQTAWTSLKRLVAGITAVLVVLPAMINAGVDVYNALLNIPKSDSERVNAELFRKYFNKPAMTSFPVPIKHAVGTVEARFSIYEEGDIFVEFGNSSQWFAFPKDNPRNVAGVEVFRSAFAQDQAGPRGIGHYKQQDQFDGNVIIRKKIYDNGVSESQRIDIRTGRITDQSTTRSAPKNIDHDFSPIGVIDLEAQKRLRSNTGATASVCTSKLGPCSILVPIPKGAQCYCYTASGPTPGVAQ